MQKKKKQFNVVVLCVCISPGLADNLLCSLIVVVFVIILLHMNSNLNN